MDGWWNEETKNQELLLRIQSAPNGKIIKLMKSLVIGFNVLKLITNAFTIV